jgi:ABC-type Mn2+/Zn2+ transport system permease subunit
MFIAVGLTLLYNTGGLALSFQLDVPTGPFIVLAASVVYGLSFLVKRRS